MSLWKVKQKQAARAYKTFVATVTAVEDPRQQAKKLEEYVASHPDNQFTRDAKAKLQVTTARIPRYEFDATIRSADTAGEQYESAAVILDAYLKSSPPTEYRAAAEKRLASVPKLIDDRDFYSIERRFPEDTPDLEGRRVALQGYLVQHPHGNHADAANKGLAQIDDTMDDRTFQRVLSQAQSLRNNRRWNEAVAAVDAGLSQVKSDKRKAALRNIKQDALAAVENEELQGLRKMAEQPPGDKQKAISACRLFLLVNPQSPHAQEVRSLLDKLTQENRAAEWKTVKESLAAVAGDPAKCIQILDGYRDRWADEAGRKALQQAAIPYHVELFRIAMAKVPVVNEGTLAQKDGQKVTGEITKKASLYYVKDERGKTHVVAESNVQGVTYSAKTLAAQEIANKAAQLVPTATKEADLRAIISLADKHALPTYALPARILLSEMNPDDRDTAQAVSATGYRHRNGRWAPPAETNARTRARSVLDTHKDAIIKAAQDTANGLGLHLTVRSLLDDSEIPLKCNASFASFDIDAVSGDTELLKATAQGLFRVTFRVDTANAPKLTQEVQDHVNKELKKLNKPGASGEKPEFVADVEIEEHREDSVTTGMELALRNGVWTVDKVSPGGPADKAWIEAGDQLIAINSTSVTDQTPEEQITGQLNTSPNSSATLQLVRRARAFTVRLPPMEVTRSVLKTRYRIHYDLKTGKIKKAGLWSELPDIDVPR